VGGNAVDSSDMPGTGNAALPVFRGVTQQALDAKYHLDASGGRPYIDWLAGVVLHDDPRPVRAAACTADGPHLLRLTLTDGRYHQVKRMVAAVGNRVEALHRCAFGKLQLDGELAPGRWR
jgi:hypothetical protein